MGTTNTEQIHTQHKAQHTALNSQKPPHEAMILADGRSCCRRRSRGCPCSPGLTHYDRPLVLNNAVLNVKQGSPKPHGQLARIDLGVNGHGVILLHTRKQAKHSF